MEESSEESQLLTIYCHAVSKKYAVKTPKTLFAKKLLVARRFQGYGADRLPPRSKTDVLLARGNRDLL